MAAEQNRKKIVILAGPNGAGKTTFAREYLPGEADCRTFVNADLIAAGLSPFEPERAAVKAARLLRETIAELVDRGESFAFETTLAGRSYARQIVGWKRKGYRVKIIFLKLPSVDFALHRVALRVLQGGHDVPEVVIRRRFSAGWSNFVNIYRDLMDSWVVYDNSGETLEVIDRKD